MGEELNKQMGAETETPAAPTSEATTETTTPATTEGTTQAPDIQAVIEKALADHEAKVREEYERKGDGHLSKLRSKYDKRIAALERQIREQNTGRMEEARGLMESDPAQAAQILASIVEAQSQDAMESTARQDLGDWQRRILEDLGADLDSDEEAAGLATEWTDRLLDDPNLTWDFQQAAARLQLERKEKAAKQAAKELADLKENLPAQIQAEITRALVSAGVVPEPSGDGEPAERDENWRDLPAGQLIQKGLAERMKRPIKR